ncbi:MAG: UTP--glucose-1-phosphate uridylyltransferase GalU [Solirubrobacterales bacterium]
MYSNQVMKAVIPAAGWGTRFLPATKAQPKEMLPLIDKPAIQYIVEEAKDSGIHSIMIVTGKNKKSIEDHFDRSVELESMLRDRKKVSMLDLVEEVGNLMEVHYIRQKEQLGLGHAVYCAHNFIHDEPFAVLLPDDIILGESPCIGQMIEAYRQTGTVIVAVMEVPNAETRRYGIVEPAEDPDQPVFRVKSLVEKPDPDRAPSNLAVIGRYILTPDILPILAIQSPGAGGEIQLTDALNTLAGQGRVHAFRFSGTRYDIGEKFGFLQATIEIALARPDLGDSVSRYLMQRFSMGA